MKRVMVLLVFVLLVFSAAGANELYQQDSLEMELSVDGSFELIPTKSGANVNEVSAALLLRIMQVQ